MTSPPPTSQPKRIPLRIRLPFATEAEFIARYGLHVSRSTLFIATRAPKPVKTALTFELVLSDNSRLMRGEGLVEELRAEPEHGRQGMLVRLTRVDARTKELIDRILALRQNAPRGEPRPPKPPVKPAFPTSSTVEDLGVLPQWLTAPDPTGAEPPAPACVEAEPQPPSRPSRPVVALPTPAPEPAIEAPPAQAPVSARRSPEADLVLGIDLGAAQCRAAVFVEGSARLVPLPLEGGATALPAIVAIDDRGALIAGSRARAMRHRSVIGLERLLGRRRRSKGTEALAGTSSSGLCADAEGDTAVELEPGPRSVADLVAELLKVLKAAAETMVGRAISRAVLCTPLWYSAHQRSVLRRAATLAGLEVVTLVNDPSAAVMAFGFGRSLARKRVLIFDWAGGAFGVSVVEITGEDIEVVCAGGDDLLGGLELVPAAVGQSVEDAAPDEAMIRGLVERAVEATRGILLTAGLQPQSLDELLVTGTEEGAAVVRTRLEQLIGRPPSAELDPGEAPAIGAALFGHSLVERSQGKRGLALFEVLGAPIGVAIEGGGFHKVLERNTRLPAEKTLAVPARAKTQRSIAVFQGPSAQAQDNEYLGLVTATADRDGDLEIRFSVSADGRLALSGRSPSGQPLEIGFDTSAADPESLARRLASATLGDPRSARPAQRGLFEGLRRLFGG